MIQKMLNKTFPADKNGEEYENNKKNNDGNINYSGDGYFRV
jgi:hypothetical protein